jgi:hypothetical protein
MSKTAIQLITDAFLQTGMIPQENANVPAYMINQGLVLLNDIILMWGSDTSLAPYQNVINFNFVANQQCYKFGIGDQYDVNTEPMIDILSFTYEINPGDGNNLVFACEMMTETEYASILYRGVATYPAQYLMRPFAEYTELVVQPLPQQDFPVQLVLKQRLAEIGLYQDLECRFPPGFLLCLKYQLMLDICDAFSFECSTSFQLKAANALKSMQANNKMDLYSRKTETISDKRRQVFPFTGWFT